MSTASHFSSAFPNLNKVQKYKLGKKLRRHAIAPAWVLPIIHGTLGYTYVYGDCFTGTNPYVFAVVNPNYYWNVTGGT